MHELKINNEKQTVFNLPSQKITKKKNVTNVYNIHPHYVELFDEI